MEIIFLKAWLFACRTHYESWNLYYTHSWVLLETNGCYNLDQFWRSWLLYPIDLINYLVVEWGIDICHNSMSMHRSHKPSFFFTINFGTTQNLLLSRTNPLAIRSSTFFCNSYSTGLMWSARLLGASIIGWELCRAESPSMVVCWSKLLETSSIGVALH